MIQPPEVVAIVLVCGMAAVVSGVRMLIQHKERMAQIKSAPSSTRDIDTRLERLEQAVDSIAIEIERTGEAQRFLTKVITERQSSEPGSSKS